MKKIFLGSIAFFIFSISIALLQTSCGKDAIASPVMIKINPITLKAGWSKTFVATFPFEINAMLLK